MVSAARVVVRSLSNHHHKQDFVLAKIQTVETSLTEYGIDYEFQVTNGGVRGRCGGNPTTFVPLLFQR